MYGQNMPEGQLLDIKNELAIRNLIDIVSNPSFANLLPKEILEEAKKSIAIYAAITAESFSKEMDFEAKNSGLKL